MRDKTERRILGRSWIAALNVVNEVPTILLLEARNIIVFIQHRHTIQQYY